MSEVDTRLSSGTKFKESTGTSLALDHKRTLRHQQESSKFCIQSLNLSLSEISASERELF
jgi:hypothetical protein